MTFDGKEFDDEKYRNVCVFHHTQHNDVTAKLDRIELHMEDQRKELTQQTIMLERMAASSKIRNAVQALIYSAIGGTFILICAWMLRHEDRIDTLEKTLAASMKIREQVQSDVSELKKYSIGYNNHALYEELMKVLAKRGPK